MATLKTSEKCRVTCHHSRYLWSVNGDNIVHLSTDKFFDGTEKSPESFLHYSFPLDTIASINISRTHDKSGNYATVRGAYANGTTFIYYGNVAHQLSLAWNSYIRFRRKEGAASK